MIDDSTLVLILAGAGVVLLLVAGWLSLRRYALPKWSAAEWLKFIALIAAIMGAGVLTFNRLWLVWILQRGGRLDEIAWIAYGDTLIIGLAIYSLGYAITPRHFEANVLGATVNTSGGEGVTTVDITARGGSVGDSDSGRPPNSPN
jgi:hypothetical protein